MAHRLLQEEIIEKPKKKKLFRIPNLNGKFGFAFFIGSKEIFIGVSIGQVEIEQIVRRKFVKTLKAGVKVFRFD